MTESILKLKSYNFAIQIVNLSKYLVNDKKEFILSKQLLKSGTSVGALIREAEFAQSKSDFINKMSISLKEANETDYWLDLLNDTGYLNNSKYDKLKNDCRELISILVASIKTSKKNK